MLALKYYNLAKFGASQRSSRTQSDLRENQIQFRISDYFCLCFKNLDLFTNRHGILFSVGQLKINVFKWNYRC